MDFETKRYDVYAQCYGFVSYFLNGMRGYVSANLILYYYLMVRLLWLESLIT